MFFKVYFNLLVVSFFIFGSISVGYNLVLDHSKNVIDILEIILGLTGIFFLFLIIGLLIKNKLKQAVQVFGAYLCFYMLFFLSLLSYHYSVHMLGLVLSMFLLYISLDGKAKKITIYGIVITYITIGILQTFRIIPEHPEEMVIDMYDRVVLLIQISLIVLGLAASMSKERRTVRTIKEVEIISKDFRIKEVISDETRPG